MENATFDRLTRSRFGAYPRRTTRRGMTRLLGGLALGGPLTLLEWNQAAAKCKKKCGPCKRCTKGKCKPARAGTACSGGTCQRGACVASASPPACVSQDPALVCAGGCGIKTDTCGRAVTCACPAGQACLGNGTCAGQCNPGADSCPAGCGCPNNISVEGAFHCIPLGLSCDTPLKTCQSSAECPQGTYCLVTQCGANGSATNRCAPLCAG